MGCPICGREAARFEPFSAVVGGEPRPNARCPSCGSLERHRLIWLYMQRELGLIEAGGRLRLALRRLRPGRERLRMLHIAPEPCLRRHLARQPHIEHVTADLEPGRGDLRMDVTDIEMPDESFDLIYASHVLEHVPDDRLAMRELRRVLRRGGHAILQVPVMRELTDEDPSVTDPEERLRRFGQDDHVRIYGEDYPDRLREAGFEVKVDPYPERLGAEERRRHGLMARERIYLCTRGEAPASREPAGTGVKPAGAQLG